MSGDKDLSRLKTGDEVCLFKKDGLLPITCGLLKYFNERHDLPLPTEMACFYFQATMGGLTTHTEGLKNEDQNK